MNIQYSNIGKKANQTRALQHKKYIKNSNKGPLKKSYFNYIKYK